MVAKVLITYFGAFEGVPKNPTDYLAHAVCEAVRNRSDVPVDIVLQELPVVFGESAQRLRQTLDAVSPDAVIALGVAVGRNKVSLERVAINLDDARIADTDDVQRRDTPIVPGAPAAYFSTLPTREILKQASALNLPVELSYTAGTYVCNHVFYALMHEVAATNIPAGFIHIPALNFGRSTNEVTDELAKEPIVEPPLVAHVDAGGVEVESVPTIDVEEAIKTVFLVIQETMKKGIFV